jgi:2-keto-3-deoxy-L-rhamnonate aldolase RhmA
MNLEFRSSVRRGTTLAGTFIKTPAHHVIEIAGASGLDFVVLDAEHAAFSADALDRCLLACAAARVPGIVRLPDATPATVLRMLDLGADGILAPHVVSAEDARAIVAASRYRHGLRGFSNSPRAGGYGSLPMGEHIEASDAGISVLCQIEDSQAVECVEDIAAVEGVDCLFIGRADLAVSYQAASLDDPRIDAAVERSVAAGRAHGVPVGIFVADATQVQQYAARGISFFIVGSDQSVLRSGLQQIARSRPCL